MKSLILLSLVMLTTTAPQAHAFSAENICNLKPSTLIARCTQTINANIGGAARSPLKSADISLSRLDNSEELIICLNGDFKLDLAGAGMSGGGFNNSPNRSYPVHEVKKTTLILEDENTITMQAHRYDGSVAIDTYPQWVYDKLNHTFTYTQWNTATILGSHFSLKCE